MQNQNDVLVVPKSTADQLGLTKVSYLSMTDEVAMLLTKLLSRRYYLSRDVAEHSTESLQIIPYVTVVNDHAVLCYRRAGTEDRLHDYYSIGFGGHVQRYDYGCVYCSLTREMEEELGLPIVRRNLFTAGIVYDNSSEVSSVHLGIHYVYVLQKHENVKPSEEIADLQALPIEQIRKLNLESWSRICLNAIDHWWRYVEHANKAMRISAKQVGRALRYLDKSS